VNPTHVMGRRVVAFIIDGVLLTAVFAGLFFALANHTDQALSLTGTNVHVTFNNDTYYLQGSDASSFYVVELLIGLEAISEPDERGMRTVMCILNGQLRPVVVRDRSIASDVPTAEKADRSNPDHIAAPFAGVVTVNVEVGDQAGAGQTIATIEAMKMEAAITAPKAGKVSRVAVSATAQVEGGDLLVVVS